MLIPFKLKGYSSNYNSSHLIEIYLGIFIYFAFLNRFFKYMQPIKHVNMLEGQVVGNPQKKNLE